MRWRRYNCTKQRQRNDTGSPIGVGDDSKGWRGYDYEILREVLRFAQDKFGMIAWV